MKEAHVLNGSHQNTARFKQSLKSQDGTSNEKSEEQTLVKIQNSASSANDLSKKLCPKQLRR